MIGYTDVWFTNLSGQGMPFHISPYIKDLDFSTEIWKGYSTCNLTVSHGKISSLPLTSLTGKSEITIFVNGDLCWKGRIESITSSTTEIKITGLGGYAFLEDYSYDDGAFRYPIIFQQFNPDYPAEGSGGQLQLSDVSERYGFATEVTSSLNFDTVLLSFSVRLWKYVDGSAPDGTEDLKGYITPFYSEDLTTFVNFSNVDVSAVGTDGYETVEFRCDNPIVIPAGHTFWVGINVNNPDYVDTATTYTHLRFNSYNTGAPATNSAWYYSPVTFPEWTEFPNHTLTSVVVSDGKWNYTPGATQDIIIEDILDEYQRKFGTDIVQKVIFVSAPYQNNMTEMPYFQIREPLSGIESLKEVLKYGINISGNLYPVFSYVYSSSQTPDGGRYNLIIKPIDFSQRAFGLVQNSDVTRSVDLNFGEMFTQVKVYFENTDGFKEETTAYYTNNPYVFPREKRIEAQGIEMGEADIIAELQADLENNFKNQRQVTIKFNEVYGVAGLSTISPWRLKAGDYIYLPTPTNTNFANQLNQDIIKFFVSGTSCNPINGTITLDLGFETDKDRLLAILGVG